MEFNWLDLFNFFYYLNIYYQNSPPTDECLKMLIDAQKNMSQQTNSQIEYFNKVRENFEKENKCFTNN